MKQFFILLLAVLLQVTFLCNVFAEEKQNKDKVVYRHPVEEQKQYLFTYLIKANPENDAIIHEVFPEGVFDAIIEDAIFLLPLDLVKAIAGNPESFLRLIKKSKFVHKNDYWLNIAYNKYSRENIDSILLKTLSVIDEHSKIDFSKLSKSDKQYYNNALIDAFAGTIKPIIEFINSTPNDPTGDIMSFRMSQFMKERNANYVVRYGGYNDVPMPTLIDKLETLRNSKIYNDLFYVAVVTAVADIWTNLWRSAGYEDFKSPPQVFLVQSADLKMKAVLDLSLKVKDFKEWDLVARRDHLQNRTAFIADLVEKRIDDNVRENVRLSMANKEAEIAKLMKGTQDPIPVFKGQSVYEAVKFQQEYFNLLLTKRGEAIASK